MLQLRVVRLLFVLLLCTLLTGALQRSPTRAASWKGKHNSKMASEASLIGDAQFSSSAHRSGLALLATAASELEAPALSMKDRVAKFLGYSMGIGAMSLYAPIIIKLLSTRSSDGFSIATWVFNVLGTMLAITYPAKKKFSFSTYVELTAVLAQGVAILGLVCLFQGMGTQYLLGIVPVLAVFTAFMFYDNVPPPLLNSLQVASIVLCTGANIPQILLTYQMKSASWSWITASLSAAGCSVRIFTTLQLTKDKLALVGYALGFITNSILVGQVAWYR
ncbi:hypothetical protein B484DRAFT_447969 [Ochromonadaceae sp. CCMP2298]|nr:hypothetical protein B484DRAFT_447969 [Ochromonadaceae sp. CCMP2298]